MSTSLRPCRLPSCWTVTTWSTSRGRRSGRAAARRPRGHRRPWARALAGDAAPPCRVRHPLAHPRGLPRCPAPSAVLTRRLRDAPRARQPPRGAGRQGINAGYAEGSLAGAEAGADRLRAAGDHHGRRDAVRQDRHARRQRRTWDRLPDDARTALTEAARSTRDWLVRPSPARRSCSAAPARGQGGRPGRAGGGRRDRTGDRTPPRTALLADPQVGPTIRKIEALKADGRSIPW